MRHLALAVAVADAGGIRRAAMTIGVAQPGVTAQLKRIEQYLGAELFERRAEGVVPTTLGMQFVAEARDLLARFDELVSSARELGRGVDPSRTLRVGATDSRHLPRIMSAFVELLPDCEHETFVVGESDEALAAAEEGRWDVVVITEHAYHSRPRLGGFLDHDLGREALFVALSAGHRLASRQSVSLSDLAGEIWAKSLDQSEDEWRSLQEACIRVGFSPRLRHRGVDRVSTETLVRLGQTVALMSPHEPTGDGVVLVRLSDPGLWRRTRLLWLPDSPIAPLAERLPDLLRPAGERTG
ncbi:LysR family transcriptional regulator [Amycolatopsis alba]|uniref:LysR family transcriptional regulator n=1 Tax=Amycolatopsis alba TaxID=76020 RepID=UPI001427DFBB|nr:LysR family transcriptional regulator [Amycolatopsis alba]